MNGSRTDDDLLLEDWACEVVRNLSLAGWSDQAVRQALKATQENPRSLVRFSTNGGPKRETRANPFHTYQLLVLLTGPQLEDLRLLLNNAYRKGAHNLIFQPLCKRLDSELRSREAL